MATDEQDARLLACAGAVADGTPIDWGAAEAGVEDADRRVIQQLRALSTLTRVHSGALLEEFGDDQELLRIASAIADGRPPDWDTVEASTHDDDRLSVVRQLRLLGRLAVDLDADPSLDSAAPPPEPPSRPAQWGPLHLGEVLGSGSFGTVYRAWDSRLDREVALKLLEPGRQAVADHILHEARLLAKVRHQNVVTVYGADRVDGRVGLWMELLEGRTLKDELRERGTFGALEAAVIGMDLCGALAAVHRVGVIHRDLKAQNVFRERGGRIVLMDFGTGVNLADRPRQKLAGTPLCLPPEVFTGSAPTVQTDIYSLGVLLFLLTTGRYPVNGSTIDDLAAAHREGHRLHLRDVRPDLPAAFIRVVERALAPEARQRFATTGEMEDALSKFVSPGRDAAETKTGPERAQGRMRRFAIRSLAVVALVTAVVLGFVGLQSRLAPAGGAEIRSIAVLPVGNLSGDAANQYVADGLTEMLISELGAANRFRIISRTSVMGYRNSGKPLATIASELHVDAVLEGSVLTAKDRVRLTARLVDVRRDAVYWTGSAERPTNDVLGLADEMAQLLLDKVSTGRGGTVPAVHRTAQVSVSPEAQLEYLRGRFELFKLSTESMPAARAHFESAIAIEPRYARAHVSLARTLILLERFNQLGRIETHQKALASLQTAIQLDDTMSEAHGELADLRLYYDWNWQEAEAEYRRALELNPNNSLARSHYSRFLAARKQLDAALAEAFRAQEVDPMSSDGALAPAIALFYQRRYADAIVECQKVINQLPTLGENYFALSRNYAHSGRFDEAVAALNEALKRSRPLSYVTELARVYAAAGRREQADVEIARAVELARSRGTDLAPVFSAYLAVATGDRERAFVELARAIDARSSDMLWADVDPRLDPLRDDPRFQRIRRRIGLAN